MGRGFGGTTVSANTWHGWLRNRRLVSDSSIEIYELSLRRIEKHAGVGRRELTLQHLERFLQNGYSLQTKHLSLVAFRSHHRWGALQKHWPLNPEVFELKLPKKRKNPRPALSFRQAAILLSCGVTPVDARLIFLGLYAGMRLAEITAVDRYSFQGGLLIVPANKGHETFEVPLHAALAEKRSLILSEQPTREQIRKACLKLRHAVGLPLTPQWLRRTYSQRLRKLGVERTVIEALLGHSRNSTLDQHYVDVAWEEMSEAVSQLHYRAA